MCKFVKAQMTKVEKRFCKNFNPFQRMTVIDTICLIKRKIVS